MLRLLGIVISIGLADSLNPTTIGPALYMASGERPRARVLEFTAAVFAVYLVGGLIIALGPGQLLLSLLPHPHYRLRYAIELAVGATMIAGSALLWRYRRPLAKRETPDFEPTGRSSWVLGATITAVELPSAFPYFAAIAAVVSADVEPPREIVLLLVFNLCFVLPLLGIAATLTFTGSRAQALLTRGREFLQANWPVVLATVGLLAGAFVLMLGITGLAGTHHGHFGRLMRRVHRIIHP